jgi:opacity protein-like surface antigen
VRSDLNLSAFSPMFSGGFGTEGTKTGWKAILGLRPLSVIGAEAEYLDFGNASGSASIPATALSEGINATVSSHPKAAAVFAMGYLPIPLPFLDIFAKAGAARLKSSVNANAKVTCPTSLNCIQAVVPPYSASGSSTRFAYGAGLQVKVAGLAVRAEYERISANGGGDADLLSLALTWSL